MRDLAKLVNRTLRPLGIRIARAPGRVWPIGDAADGVATLIDVGCAFGTPEFYAVKPDAPIFLIDALVEYVPQIERLLSRRSGGYEITALGAKSGELVFNVEVGQPTRSSALGRTELTKSTRKTEARRVSCTTLDSVVSARSLPGPFGLKIDSEGYELEILRGAKETLRTTRFVIAETSVERRFEGSYSFLELIAFMDEHGFDMARVLSAHADENDVIRFLDVLFVKRLGSCER